MSTFRTYLRCCWLPAVLLLLFLLLASLRLSDPMGQDELSHYYKLIRLLFHGGFQHPENLITFSPHAYPLWVTAVCLAVGVCSPLVVKSAGIFLWLICLLLVSLVSQRLTSRQSACSAAGSSTSRLPGLFFHSGAILSLAVCVTMPAVIQATVTVDIDQAALPLLILLLCLAAERWCRLPTRLTSAYLILAFTLALWGRITTPVVLAPVLLLHAGLAAPPGQRRQAILRLAALLGLGAILFLFTWWLYCQATGINHAGIFQYFSRSLQETTFGERSGSKTKLLQNIAAVLLWGCNPFFLAALIVVVWRRLNVGWRCRQLQPADIYWLSAAAILGGYVLVGGSLFGFPKYQCPAIPLLAISLSANLTISADGANNRRGQPLWSATGLTVGAALLAVLLLPDPIYSLRVALRIAQLQAQPLRPILLSISFRLAGIYLLTAAAGLCCVWFRRLSVLSALLAVGLGLNLALLVVQAAVNYSTGYMYGEKGETSQVAELIKAHQLESQPLFVPVEVVQHLGWSDDRTPGPDLWNDPQLVARRISEEQPALVGMSVLISPVPVLRCLLTDQRVQQALAADYELHEIGHFLLWVRNRN